MFGLETPELRVETISRFSFRSISDDPMSSSRQWKPYISFSALALLLSFSGCSSKPQVTQKAEPSATSSEATADESLQSADSAAPGYSLHLPPSFGRWTGDYDELAKHNILRMLVLYNKTGFFYDKGR